MSEPGPDPRWGVSPSPNFTDGAMASSPAGLIPGQGDDGRASDAADNIDVQFACALPGDDWPDANTVRRWVLAALPVHRQSVEVAVRIVDQDEGLQLNQAYRGRDYATNVLSFEADLPEGVEVDLLGDIVICAPVVAAEAEAQGKPVRAHFAHLVVHGTLHLLGHDHLDDAEANVMEGSECEILARLGFADPYADDER